MIKLCEVLAFNKITHIVVVKFDGLQVQFITDKDNLGSTVYVKNDAGSYEIVDESEYGKSFRSKKNH